MTQPKNIAKRTEVVRILTLERLQRVDLVEFLLRDDDVTFRVEAGSRRLAVSLQFVEATSRSVDLRFRLVDLRGGRRVQRLLLRQNLCEKKNKPCRG